GGQRPQPDLCGRPAAGEREDRAEAQAAGLGGLVADDGLAACDRLPDGVGLGGAGGREGPERRRVDRDGRHPALPDAQRAGAQEQRARRVRQGAQPLEDGRGQRLRGDDEHVGVLAPLERPDRRGPHRGRGRGRGGGDRGGARRPRGRGGPQPRVGRARPGRAGGQRQRRSQGGAGDGGTGPWGGPVEQEVHWGRPLPGAAGRTSDGQGRPSSDRV
ncbi:MAG: hypothetical protein AVDCRST_MAG54-4091, partial [uncultured Actinomycetospora sp.]